MAKYTKILDVVTELLNKNPHLRDSDRKLVSTVWWKHIGEPVEWLNGMDILKMYADGDLPDVDSITRCRRKIQEHNVELRGEKWKERRTKLQDKVKKELNSYKSTRKKLNKAKLKRNLVKTPYPVGFEYKRSTK